MLNNKCINKYILNNTFFIYKLDKFKNNLIIIENNKKENNLCLTKIIVYLFKRITYKIF